MNSRRKGASGEREFAAVLHEHLGARLVRNLEQVRNGGRDLLPPEGDDDPLTQVLAKLAIEVKRYRTASTAITAQERLWWAQAASKASGLVPVLAWRADRGFWRVLVPLAWLGFEVAPVSDHAYTVALSVTVFAALVRERGEGDET